MPRIKKVESDRARPSESLTAWPPRWFEDIFELPSVFGTMIRGVPADIYETDDQVVVKMPIPGIRPEDVEISVARDTVTVRGEVEEEKEEKEQKKEYYYRALRYGSMARTFTLPTPVTTEGAEARVKNGVLTLTLPKAEEAKPKRVQVKAEGK
jgi:HSP20 family protein